MKRKKKYWLKMVGMAGLPVQRWNEQHVEFARRFRKKNGREVEEGPPRINKGDVMVLYATGYQKLFAVAKVTRAPYRHNDPNRWARSTYSVDLEYKFDPVDPVTDGPHGPTVNPRLIGTQRGYKSITCEEFQQAAKALGIPCDDC